MAKKEDIRYFNFPIVLLEGFLDNEIKVLNNIFDYSLVSYCDKYDVELSEAANYFGVTIGNEKKTFNNGRELVDTIDIKCPKTGLSKDMFFEYYKNEKEEFEKVVLLAFLAIKSILQNQACSKIDNKYLFSRMAGIPKKIKSIEEIKSKELMYHFHKDYRIPKIKKELILNWGLIHYGISRGFWVSYKMTLENLIFHAESKKKSSIEKSQKAKEKDARDRALARIST